MLSRYICVIKPLLLGGSYVRFGTGAKSGLIGGELLSVIGCSASNFSLKEEFVVYYYGFSMRFFLYSWSYSASERVGFSAGGADC